MPPVSLYRDRVCAGLAGEVVEIGFGTGHNLPFLPAAVTRLRVVEPSGAALVVAGSCRSTGRSRRAAAFV